MAKDFEHSHKNLELLRYYISKDIKSLNKKEKKDNSEIISCFLGSLIDILVVLFFQDALKNVCIPTWKKILIKIICIFALIFLFFLVRNVYMRIRRKKIKKRMESGRHLNESKDEQDKMIDSFDNIACDALLICHNYIEGYRDEAIPYIKKFYLYEIIHYLYKAERIYNSIVIVHSDLFISEIGSYRIDNFKVFAKSIFDFLKKEQPIPSSYSDLDRIMYHLSDTIGKW